MSKPKAGKRPVPSCHPSPTLSQTVRQLQHHFSVAKSVTSTARQDVRTQRCDWKHPRPAHSLRRRAIALSNSPTLSQTARGHRHSPNTVSRCRKICGAHHPRQDVCNRRCNRNLKVTKLPETSHRRSPTLSQTLRCRGHRPTTASRCSRVRRVDLPRQDRASIGFTGYQM